MDLPILIAGYSNSVRMYGTGALLHVCLFQYGGGFHNVRTQHILMDVLHIWIDVVGLAQAVWAP